MQKQKSATTITVGDREFVSHLYSASQALDLLLLLGEVLAEPLSKILDQKISADLTGILEALSELRNQDLLASLIPPLVGSIRRVGGSDVLIQILATTWYEDAPISTRKRLDEVFGGPAGAIDAVRLTKEVLVYQLGPLSAALRPRPSGQDGAGE